jgi:hypothetical protein
VRAPHQVEGIVAPDPGRLEVKCSRDPKAAGAERADPDARGDP